MQESQREYFIRRLSCERDELASVLTSLQDELKDSMGELSLVDQHPADVGSEMFEREKTTGLVVHIEERLRAVAEALERLQEGAYGMCAYCGQDIGFDRLDVWPSALLCIQCSLEQERS